MSARRLILRSFQSPGDIVMLTAAVRDLHLAHAGEFETDVRTTADAIWQHNPHITRLNEGDAGVTSLDMHYPLIHECNQRPYHFIHGYPQYLEQQLGLKIPVTRFSGDIHLSTEERQAPPPRADLGVPEHFWIVVAGGKNDFTAKWWNPERYQAVVDHFRGKITFVQCGEAGHWHLPLDGVINLVGKTETRSFIRLMHHADGVLCPVTFAMHLAAAVETKPGRPRHRPCVVVAGGREPAHWEAYPHHQFLSTVGTLPCCADGGCWNSRCQPVGDGDPKDHHDVCVDPVQIRHDLRIPRCMDLITAEQVIERIELYYRGKALHYTNGKPTNGQHPATSHAQEPPPAISTPEPEQQPAMNVLITFRHGLGDGVQLTVILKHLQKYRPGWNVDVAALVGKHSAYEGLCRKVYVLDRESPPCCQYSQKFSLGWHECHSAFADSPSTKVERCLREEFGITPDPELCTYSIRQSDEAVALARRYLEQICQVSPGKDGRYPVVMIHYEGNTSAEYKNIPTEIMRRLCDEILAEGYIPVILDWDRRTPLADGVRVFNPDADAQLWRGTGTGDAETLAALIELSSLMIGVDSGPLHVAGATTTPTLGVWIRHHPLHYFALADNVTHLVPRNHSELIRGDRAPGDAYFNAHYRYQVYDDLEIGLQSAVRARLSDSAGGLVFTRNFWVRTDNAEQDLVVVLDIAEHDSYRVDDMPMPRPVVVDVGAHIGCFSKRLHDRNPLVRIFAVECCPENIPALQKNVGGMATVIPAAVTYEPDVALLNAVYRNCLSTGGSTIIGRNELERRVAARQCATAPGNEMPSEYWADFRPIRTVTLEDLMREHGFEQIDILKLDCEGSEFSILGKTPSLDRIGLIVGEYHGEAKFEQLVSERFADWTLKILRAGELGTFWLINPRFDGTKSGEVARSAAGGGPAHSQNGTDGTSRPGSETVPAVTSAIHNSKSEILSDSPDDFCRRLATAFHDDDHPQLEWWLPYYRRLYELARELSPQTICEIGVRAGYSAFAMLSANPQARLLGIEADGDETAVNTHNGRKGMWAHARRILEPFDFQLLIVDSRSLRRLPDADLVYVDGDHSYRGCLADLRLAGKSGRRILVDDYDNFLNVRQACETFMHEHPEFERRYIDNELTGFLLFERKPSP